MGELAAAEEEEKVFWFFLYLSFGGGVFGTAAAAESESAAGPYLVLSLSRSGEFGREEREERKGNIRYISQRSSFGLGGRKEKRREKETRTFREVGRKSLGLFLYLYIYIYIYII